MELPLVVRVGPFSYTVSVESNMRATDDPRIEVHGEIVYAQRIIRIDQAIPADFQLQTFMHELLHAADDLAESKLSEKRVTRLNNAILCLLLDNPAILRLLLERSKELSRETTPKPTSFEPYNGIPSKPKINYGT